MRVFHVYIDELDLCEVILLFHSIHFSINVTNFVILLAEIEVAEALMKLAKTLGDVESYGVKAFARALEVIPYTLAENAGLDPVKTVTELRKVHQDGDKTAGINVKRGVISSMQDEHVLQPALVTSNVIQLASETVCSILKIDDIDNTIR